jgi:hypothetical protein
MVAPSQSPAHPESPRRPARDLIDAVVENMRRNLEPLKYSTLVPSRYIVYLHPVEFGRFEQIIPLLQEQTSRALDEALARLNAGRPVRRVLDRVLGAPPPVENAAREWQVDFVADPDAEVAEGDILVHSELVLPGRDEPAAGQRTRRIATMHVGQRTTTREETVSETRGTSSGKVLARLRYEDEAGPQVFDMTSDTLTIGRGGAAFRVDVRIETSADVSREHLRVRRDPATGRFFVADVSMLGSTLNGKRLPKGYDEVDGVRQSNGVETLLTDGARLGLADTVYVTFEVVSR